MLIRIEHVLGARQLKTLRAMLARASFLDGVASAGRLAAAVKVNEELARDEPLLSELNELVMGNLVRHPTYQSAALPLRAATPLYVRYLPDMTYGAHVDDPVMGAGAKYRADIAVTVFLSDPDEYDGGELTIETDFGEQSVKEAAGTVVMYPASSRHRVSAVTKGMRLVAVTWVQSLVRDAGRRELLYELHRARAELLKRAPQAPETARVDLVYSNLVRMWAEV